MKFWRNVFAVIRKDALAEMRTKEVVSAVLVFTLLVIVIFNFAFGTNAELVRQVAAGMLWVTFAFTGVLGLNRSFIMEKEEGCMEGLMVAPVEREAIYTGKMLGGLLFMLVIEAVALPIFAFLFNLNVFSLALIVIIVLTTIGFVAVGTLFSALAVNTKAREMVLPILFFPIVAPVIISAVEASTQALAGGPWSGMMSWLEIIAAFDVVFVVASFLVFAYVIEE